MSRYDRDDRNRSDGKGSRHESHERGRYSDKKRKHSSSRDRIDDDSSSIGVGSTLARLQQPDLPQFNLTSGERRAPDNSDSNRDNNKDGWETVDRPSKKQKKIPKPSSSNYPAISFSNDARLQSKIKISDLQGLVLYLLADGPAPQWVSVKHRPQIRKVVVLMVPGLEQSDFNHATRKEQTDEDAGAERRSNTTSPDEYYPMPMSADGLSEDVRSFADMFEHLWPVRTPGDDKFGKMHSPLHAMLSAPLPKNQEEKSKGVQSAREPQGWKNNRTPISEYISTSDDLIENEYVLHPASYSDPEEKRAFQESRFAAGTSNEHGWVDTEVTNIEDGTPPDRDIEKGSITAGREVLAMDCEMVKTGESEFSLTRISIVTWDGTVLMDELVKPDKPIIDYLTMYSGMTKEMLDPVTTTLQDIQQKLIKILHPRTILIGHSLNSDLTALKLTHPFIIDTALLYPHPRGPPLKSSLKYLAKKYLNKEIQKGHGSSGPGAGHDSIEDARTCLDLVKQKCEKGAQWGTSDSVHENLFKRLARTGVRYKNQGGSSTPSHTSGKSTAAVDWGNPKLGAGNAANFVIGCKNDEEVTTGIIRAVKGDSDGLEIPGDGVDFVWGRMRELEASRGWWNTNKVVKLEPIQSDGIKPEESLADLGESKSMEDSSATSISTAADHTITPLTDASLQPIATTSEPPPVTNLDPPAEPDAIREPPTAVQDIAPSSCLSQLTSRIKQIYDALPPCTAFIIYSGSGDPRKMSELQQMQQTFKREYKVKKWDQLSIKWTDTEEQALKAAAKAARNGLGFVTVK